MPGNSRKLQIQSLCPCKGKIKKVGVIKVVCQPF